MLQRLFSLFALAALLSMFTITAAAQDVRATKGGSVSGRILDEQSGRPIDYANVVLHHKADSSMALGTISDAQGRFTLGGVAPGEYYLVIHFIGYSDFIYPNITMRRDAASSDVGDIRLVLKPIEMAEVEVDARRAPVVYQIDKKVISVDGQLTAASGTAVDVLRNVPSVTVDLDGSVRLRGSGSFTVLIDGRPTVLDASDALQQIPSSAIENIEIITNPSARYNPEGMSGIINVVMKKEGALGNSGMVNLGAGWDDNYGLDGLYTMRFDGFTAFVGADYNKRYNEGTQREVGDFLNAGELTTIRSDGTSTRERERWSLRAGLELPLSESSRMSLSARYGNHSHGGGTALRYFETVGAATPRPYTSRGNSTRSGEFFGADAEFRHRFDSEKHVLLAQFSFRRREGEEASLDELLDAAGAISSGRRATEDGPGRMIEAKLDYTLPFSEDGSIVAGYELRDGASDDITSLSEFNPSLGDYERLAQFDRSTTYERRTQGVYSLYANSFGALGLQAGLRVEHTDRRVQLAANGGSADLEHWDYFPTLHASYGFSPTRQLMAGYTRRIEHSRGWFLEPFETWIDAYNVRRGNPDLKPEYIDSYELGYQTHIGEALLSAEAYHRSTHNKVELVRSIYRDNITLRSAENVGRDYSTGLELMLNTDVLALWNVNLLGNLFDYRVEGAMRGQDFSESSFTWNARLNNTLTLAPGTMLQINASYNSASVSAQGRTEGYFVTDIAVRQELFNRQLALTLDVSDVLRTAERESTLAGPNFSTYTYSFEDAPVVMLSLRWFINQARSDRDRGTRRGGDMGDDDF